MAWIDALDLLDKELMVWLNYDGAPWTDIFWWHFSQKLTWAASTVALIATFALRYRHHWRLFVVATVVAALVVAAADQISSGLIKDLVERPRPSRHPVVSQLLYYVGDYRGGRFGFVSSHAANSFALSTMLWMMFRGAWLRTTLLLWAVANCYSRIYLGVHYPCDIIGGAVVGIAVGVAGYYGLRAVRRSAWCAAHDTDLTHHEDISYSREPWILTLSVWLTVALLASVATLALI